jgi:hypothetical protein
MATGLVPAYGSRGASGLSQESQSLLAPERDNSAALAKSSGVETWTDPDWQRFWLTIDGLPWRTIAFVPAGEGGPPDFALSLAINLSRTGMAHIGGPMLVADGTRVGLNELTSFLADVRSCSDAGQRVIVALSSTKSDPTVPSIAKSMDGVVLCVLIGRMKSTDAKETIRLVGAKKFLGSLIIRPSDQAGQAP